MTETGASFNRPYKPFGFNVKVPEIGEKTIKLAEGTLTNIVKSPVEPLFNFLEENEKVQSQWKFFEHRMHKRRRAYVKRLV